MATDYYRRTTNLHDAEISFDHGNQLFFVSRPGKFTQRIDELDEPLATQATLCIQLALIEHFRDTGLVVPMLLNVHWIHPERPYSNETATLLNEIGQRGQQFFIIVWDKSQADFLNQCGLPVLVVDREEERTVREVYSDNYENESIDRWAMPQTVGESHHPTWPGTDAA